MAVQSRPATSTVVKSAQFGPGQLASDTVAAIAVANDDNSVYFVGDWGTYGGNRPPSLR